jgi:hypothetical protein
MTSDPKCMLGAWADSKCCGSKFQQHEHLVVGELPGERQDIATILRSELS